LARLTAGGGWHTDAEEAWVSDWDLVLRAGRMIDPKSALRLLTRGGQLSGDSGELSGGGAEPSVTGGQFTLTQALAKCSLEPARPREERDPACPGQRHFRGARWRHRR
jgi:hypothetical protein